MTKARDLSQTPNASLGFKNRIINGDMRIDQRNAGASVTPNNSYTVDRWSVGNTQTSKLTAQQNAGSVTPPSGFTNYLGVTSSSAFSVASNDTFVIQQPIEGFNIADLNWGTVNAQPVTISFWVRSSLTGTFGGALANYNGTRSYPFSYTISVANTWEQKSITITGDTTGTWLTNNNAGILVRLGLGSGSGFSATAGSWQAGNFIQPTGSVSVVGTNGATFYITGVQLEKGSTATSFDYRPYGTELQLCQRYFEKSYGQSLATGSADSTTSKGLSNLRSEGDAVDAQRKHVVTPFKVEKRANPTITFWDVNGNVNRYSINKDTGNNILGDAFSGANPTTALLNVNLSRNDGGTFRDFAVHWAASAEL